MTEYFCSPKQAGAIVSLIMRREQVSCNLVGKPMVDDKPVTVFGYMMKQRYPHPTDYLDKDAIRREFNPRQSSQLIGLLLHHSNEKITDYVRSFIKNKENR